MHPKVRDLYKRVILAGRDYPGGMEVVKRCVRCAIGVLCAADVFHILRSRRSKEWFRSNSALTDERDILKAVAKGRAYLRDEVIAAIQLVRLLRQCVVLPLSGPCPFFGCFCPNSTLIACSLGRGSTVLCVSDTRCRRRKKPLGSGSTKSQRVERSRDAGFAR